MKRFVQFFGEKTLTQSIIVLFGNGMSSLLGFAFVFLIARKLGPVNFGVFSTLIGFITFVSAIADLGISQSIVNFVARNKNIKEQKQWISFSLLLLLINVLLVSLLASFGYIFILRAKWGHQSGYELYIGLTIIFISITIYLLSVFQSIEQFVRRILFDNAFSIIRLLIVLLIIFLTGTIIIKQALLSVVLAYALALLIGFYFIKNYIIFPRFDGVKLKSLLNFSKWLAVQNLSANLYGRLDVLMLAWLSNQYITGIYASAARFMTIFPLVVSSLSAVVSPKFATFDNHQDNSSYVRRMALLVGGVSVFMLLLIPLARLLIGLAYGDEFLSSVPIFSILVLANIPLVISIPFTNTIIYYYKQPLLVGLVSMLQLLGLWLSNLILIPKYFSLGPAYSLLFMNLLGLVFYMSLFRILKSKQ